MDIKHLFIDYALKDSPIVEKICESFNCPCEFILDYQNVYAFVSNTIDPIKTGKQTLFLTQNQGEFIKKCPGTKHYLCCGYQILHFASFCYLDCSYCILQAYFHPPVLQLFVNFNQLLDALRQFIIKKEKRRIGTGEFTDSLIWEPIYPISQLFIPIFAKQSHCAIELKTKTVQISQLKEIDHNKKAIISWSLNTPFVIQNEEINTTTLYERIAAAQTCENWGYPLGFHFDPIVIYDECEKEYLEVIDLLFSKINPDSIVWISLGTFRFIPQLKSIIQNRFANSKIIYGEFITGLDNKHRYFKPLRIMLYKKIVEKIKSYAPQVLVYFCMEDEEVWHKVFGFTPKKYGGLSKMLDKSVIEHCGLDGNSERR